jgi:hypothetical protein
MRENDHPGKWNRQIRSGEVATDFIEAGLHGVLRAVDAVEKVTGLDLLKRKKYPKPPVSEREVDRSGRV